MRTIRSGSEIDRVEKGTIAALGVFDGVHLGHLALFSEAASCRARSGLPLVAMTFHPHPRTLTGEPNGYTRLLTPPEEKAALIEDAGAGYLLTVPFTREFASTPPYEFARRFLRDQLHARHVICGFNFTFGFRGAGTPQDLVDWDADLGFSVSVVPAFAAGQSAVSSSMVRAALVDGDVSEAAQCLGRPYCVSGTVVAGEGRGHKIGIPTSNVDVPADKLLPGNGVYAALARVMVSLDEAAAMEAGHGSQGSYGIRSSLAVANVGTRPTFDGQGVRLEVHMPGFEGQLYRRVMQVFFLARLRREVKFPSAAALLAQVEEDVRAAREAAQHKGSSFTMPGAYDRMLASSLP